MRDPWIRCLLIGAIALVGYGCTPEEDKPACTTDAQCTGDGETCVSGACEVVPCEDGDLRACDFGGAEGCRATQRCEGGVYGACEVPDELCNGADDDCDGETDEGFEGLGDICEDGIGECVDRGRIVCAPGGLSTQCAARAGDGGAELCDGFDNDCDGETDEDTGGAACATALPGACAIGAAICEKGDLRCVPAVEPTDELCDGVDNDCDGRTDEAAAGGPLVEPCYDGPDGTADTGACATGFRACFGGRFGACEDQALPGAEICDGVDNDCNGEADDGDIACVCVPGDIRECYTGAEGTVGVGYCVGGKQVCADDGSAWGACLEERVPGIELCDGIDTDCDGIVDEVPGVGEPCGGGVGACAVEGVRECDIGLGQVICSERPGLPGDEICNGIDDDCNGLVDDVEGAGVACRVGEGACGRTGVIACGPDDGLACDAEPGAPGDETCNGIDDDCDGVVDDVEGLGDACEVGVGACRSTGIQICGAAGLTCGAVAGEPGVELCGNRIDDDCDGEVDDDDECSRCGNGERNLDETCDDGNREAGDGCDADCQVEAGFDCFDGPADTPVTVDGRDCRGTDLEVPAWVGGYGVGYVGGAVQIAADARYVGAYAVDVGVGPAQTISIIAGYDDNGRFLEAPTAGGARARIAGRFDRLPAGDFAVRFPDINCSDNAGAVDVEFRTLDLCRPTACDVDADCVFADQTCFEGECLPRDCGDGRRAAHEGCDDGNRVDGDGCDRRCEVEDGFVCATGPAGDDCAPICQIDSNCIDPDDRCVDGVCAIPESFCGDGEVGADEQCDDGNAIDRDGCAADCTAERAFVCEDFSFRFGAADRIPAEDLPAPVWRVDEDGRGITETANAAPGHYATNLPISPDYVTRFEITVDTAEDDDTVGWTIGGGPTALSAPDQPYLLFSWKQRLQDAPGFGLARTGLRVGQVTGALLYDELWQATGDHIVDLGDALTLGETGWVDRQTYTVEIVGDSERLMVYVDGVLEFDLSDVALGDGTLGLYSYSQPAFSARLVTPESIQVCRPVEAFCGDGEIGDDEECDDGNVADLDGCGSDCTVEPGFACDDFSFGFGATDTVPFADAPLPEWGISEDGRTITQLANAQPGHYATDLPISPDYRTRFEVAVDTDEDDDQVGWAIGGGATALTAPDAPYLLFSWKQEEQDDAAIGFAPRGLRVGRVDGAVSIEDVWQFDGAITELAVGATQGDLGWVDNQTYTVEIIGDSERLLVYVDGELEFDLRDVPLGDGKLGIYTSSQPAFSATLIAPETLQSCRPLDPFCGDGQLGDDEECDDGDADDGDGCAADCTVEGGFSCDTIDFRFGQADAFPTRNHQAPLWNISADGLSVSQARNAWPGHYSTNLPINPDYITRLELAVNLADDDDAIGFAIGGGPTALTAPEQPYLLFTWRGGDALGAPGGDVLAGLRVDRVVGAPTGDDLIYSGGALQETERARTLGRTGWAYFETYTVDIVGDSERLRVYVDGVLQFDLRDAPIGDGRLGFYTNSQPGFSGRLVSPATIQICGAIDEICDNWMDDDGDGQMDCADPDCVADPFCQVEDCPEEDGLEPNDTPETAVLLGGGGSFGYWCGAPDPGEWYAIDICAGGELSASIDTNFASEDLGLDLWRLEEGGELTHLFTSRSQLDDELVRYINTGDDTQVLMQVSGDPGFYEAFVDVTGCGRIRETCDDGIDNNGDGAVDCADADCARVPACFCAADDPFEDDEALPTLVVPGARLTDMPVCVDSDPSDNFALYGCPGAPFDARVSVVVYHDDDTPPTRGGLDLVVPTPSQAIGLNQPNEIAALVDVTGNAPADCGPERWATFLPGSGETVRVAGVLPRNANPAVVAGACATPGDVPYQVIRIANDNPDPLVVDITADFRDGPGSLAAFLGPVLPGDVIESCPDPAEGLREVTVLPGVVLSVVVFNAAPDVGANQFVLRIAAAGEICDDWFDNDGDGQMDCDDPDCVADPFCQAAELCPGDDAFEPNDSPDAPTLLAPGLYDGLYWCGADDPGEWYAVDVCAGGRLKVDLLHTFADGNVELDLYRPVPGGEPVQLFASRTALDRDFIDHRSVDDDTRLLLRVLGEPNTYSLQVDVSECGVREICDDGNDNDGNGLTDCADPGCAHVPACFCAAPDPFENDEVSFTLLVPGDPLTDMPICAGTDPVDNYLTYGCPQANMVVDTTFVQFPTDGSAPVRSGLRFASDNNGVRFALDESQSAAVADIEVLTPDGCDPGDVPAGLLGGGQDIRIAGVLDADDTQLDIGCAGGVVPYQIVRVTNALGADQAIDVTADFRDRAGSLAVLREPLDGPTVPDACPDPSQGPQGGLLITAGETVSIAVFNVGGSRESNQFVVRIKTLGDFAEVCGSSFDEDGDGDIDCADADCAADPVCAPAGIEVCNSGFDDDGDGAVDCEDPDCVDGPVCTADACPGANRYGTVGIINQPVRLSAARYGALATCDLNGHVYTTLVCPGGQLTARLSSDADLGLNVRYPFEVPLDFDYGNRDGDPEREVTYTNDTGVDRRVHIDLFENFGRADFVYDLDVQIDGCEPLAPFEICFNGVDDTGDGLIDCADPSCATDGVCNPEICDNGVDENANGFVDCFDPQCNGTPACSLADQVYFTVPPAGGGVFPESPTGLYTFDPVGQPRLLHLLDTADRGAGIAALAMTGGPERRLLGLISSFRDGGVTTELVEIGLADGALSPLGDLGGIDAVGAAFDDAGILWIVDRGTASLIPVNVGALAVEQGRTIAIPTDFFEAGDIAFRHADSGRFTLMTSNGGAPLVFYGDVADGTITPVEGELFLASTAGAALAVGRGIQRCSPVLYSGSAEQAGFGWFNLDQDGGFLEPIFADIGPIEVSIFADGANPPDISDTWGALTGCEGQFEFCDAAISVDGDGDGLSACDDPDCQRTDPVCIGG